MGLTNDFADAKTRDSDLAIRKQSANDKIVAIAGNPNVGKSTLFNGLTGMKQHTGNWPGKTVTNAQGYCSTGANSYVFVDIPGTYSLMAHSAEEEIARNFLCFGGPDAVIVVCDATCIERNLNLALQTLEISSNVIVCLNLIDEARRKNIHIDAGKISARLGVPVISTVARDKKSLKELTRALDRALDAGFGERPLIIKYPDAVENAVAKVENVLSAMPLNGLNSRWLSLKLLDGDESLINEINACLGEDFLKSSALISALDEAAAILKNENIDSEKLEYMIVSSIVKTAQSISDEAVTYLNSRHDATDRRLDKILTGKLIGYPIMLLLLTLILWITIIGANYPSEMLSDALFRVQDALSGLFISLNAPEWLRGALVDGVYRVLAWVVCVMLPPMAIFFPLFTLLEDVGYLPRVAYNLDKPFKKCKACGKQSLTMCMVSMILAGSLRILEPRRLA